MTALWIILAGGFPAYQYGNYSNPYTDPKDGVQAQAWDRGLRGLLKVDAARRHRWLSQSNA
jgi:hypothetical protein